MTCHILIHNYWIRPIVIGRVIISLYNKKADIYTEILENEHIARLRLTTCKAIKRRKGQEEIVQILPLDGSNLCISGLELELIPTRRL